MAGHRYLSDLAQRDRVGHGPGTLEADLASLAHDNQRRAPDRSLSVDADGRHHLEARAEKQ